MIFTSETDYIDQTLAADRVTAIDNLITALLTTAISAVGKAAITEYKLSDGQTEIRKLYRNPNEVMATVSLLRVLRQQFINDINPSMVRLMGANNFIY